MYSTQERSRGLQRSQLRLATNTCEILCDFNSIFVNHSSWKRAQHSSHMRIYKLLSRLKPASRVGGVIRTYCSVLIRVLARKYQSLLAQAGIPSVTVEHLPFKAGSIALREPCFAAKGSLPGPAVKGQIAQKKLSACKIAIINKQGRVLRP